jgi:hypothetical protein
MSNQAVALKAPANQPQPVTWWLANYYPTDADGQAASVVGVQFKSYDDAVTYCRTTLTAAGVGVCYVQQVQGFVLYPLFDPTPF